MPDLATSIRSAPGTSVWSLLLYAAATVLGAVVLVNLIVAEEVRIAVTMMVSIILIGLAFYNIRLSIAATLVYLVFLGDIRRMLIPVAGWSETDPLLLIGPVFAIFLCGYAWASRSVTLDTPLAKWVLLLMGIMALQIFNPQQGGLIVGIAGVMFLMVPLFWFWIGRSFITPRFMRILLYKVIPSLVVLAALMGLYQIFYGYLPYQMEWYSIAGYAGIGNPESGLAPISFFASGTEHNNFLIIGIVVLWAIGLRKNASTLLLIPLLLITVIIAGSRGPVVKALFMMSGLWAILGRSKTTWILRGFLALLIAGVGLYWSLNQATQMSSLNPQVLGGLERQANEFVDAPNSREGRGSSTRVHLFMMVNAYSNIVRYPLGLGLGSTSKAVSKFGGQRAHSSETDLGDSFLTLGIPGGVVYHIIVVLIILSGFKFWLRTRSPLALALLGVLGVTFLMWLGGGQYGVSPIIWLCIGALDRFQNKDAISIAEADL